MEEIKVLKHSSIRIQNGSTILYIDPYQIEEETHDANYIFITHSHYDHFSKEDIKKIKKEDTQIITVASSEKEAKQLVGEDHVLIVQPNKSYSIKEIAFETYPAYNINKTYHPKENNWVGYLFKINGKRIYIAGDTDHLPELEKVFCDIALVPIGGTYTMTAEEAADLVNKMDVKKVIPTHYGCIVGKKEDANIFQEKVKTKQVEIQI